MCDYIVTINDTPDTVIVTENPFTIQEVVEVATVSLTEPTIIEISETPFFIQVNEQTAVSVPAERFGTTYEASFGDSTPALVYSLPLGQALEHIEVNITEVFNGIGAYLTIGTILNPTLFYSQTDSLLDDIASFDKNFYLDGPSGIYLFLNTGTGASTGKVTIQVVTIPT